MDHKDRVKCRSIDEFWTNRGISTDFFQTLMETSESEHLVFKVEQQVSYLRLFCLKKLIKLLFHSNSYVLLWTVDETDRDLFIANLIEELKNIAVLHLRLAISLVNVDSSENLFSTDIIDLTANEEEESFSTSSIQESVSSIFFFQKCCTEDFSFGGSSSMSMCNKDVRKKFFRPPQDFLLFQSFMNDVSKE